VNDTSAQPDFKGRWWEIGALRSLLGAERAGGRALGHYFGPDAGAPEFAFLAVDAAPATRSVVVLRTPAAAISFTAPGQGKPEPPRVSGSAKPTPVESMDLAGIRVADWAILFNIEPRSTRSAVWFETSGGDKLRFLLTGLAPGQWDIWCDGWLVDHGAIVRPTAGALYFTGAPGMYFVRPAS
jgi:hypothetical protein